MAVTPDVVAEVRAALAEADIEDARIEVEAVGDSVVLRGAVPTTEQAGTAALVASWHAPQVENRLRIDPHLREDTSAPDAAPEEAPAARVPGPRAGDLSVQTSSGEPEPVTRDLQQDADTALAENVPLDPPDTPHTATTAAEERGVLDRDSEPENVAAPGEAADDAAEERSLPGESRRDLEQAARPARPQTEDRRGPE